MVQRAKIEHQRCSVSDIDVFVTMDIFLFLAIILLVALFFCGFACADMTACVLCVQWRELVAVSVQWLTL